MFFFALFLFAETGPAWAIGDALPGLPPWAQCLVALVLLPSVGALLKSHADWRRVARALAKTTLELTEEACDAAVLDRHAGDHGVADHPVVVETAAKMREPKIDDAPAR